MLFAVYEPQAMKQLIKLTAPGSFGSHLHPIKHLQLSVWARTSRKEISYVSSEAGEKDREK